MWPFNSLIVLPSPHSDDADRVVLAGDRQPGAVRPERHRGDRGRQGRDLLDLLAIGHVDNMHRLVGEGQRDLGSILAERDGDDGGSGTGISRVSFPSDGFQIRTHLVIAGGRQLGPVLAQGQ